MNRWILAGVLAAVLILALVAAVGVWLLSRTPDGGPPPENPPIELAPYQTNLAWPVALAFAPDGRVFYAERFGGAIRIIANDAVVPDPFFTIADVSTSGEQGLLGLALDPDFPTSPYVYAYYTFVNRTTQEVYNRIVRILAGGNVGTTMQVIVDRIPAASFHDGGVIAFGPDGKLYAVVGDALNSASAQDVGTPNGKVLRMNPDGTAAVDNPFVNTPGANPLVYTYGHRNMFGIAFHPDTGRAYVTENGPEDSDEINRLIPGENYGWPQVRGIANTSPYIDPLIAYTPVIVPTNAAFYTGSTLPQSRNDLFFGDWKHGRLHDLRLDASGTAIVNDTILLTASEGILDVEMGPDGVIWVSTASALYRVVSRDTSASEASLSDLDPGMGAKGKRASSYAKAPSRLTKMVSEAETARIKSVSILISFD